jgi:hypothetical protein
MGFVKQGLAGRGFLRGGVAKVIESVRVVFGFSAKVCRAGAVRA